MYVPCLFNSTVCMRGQLVFSSGDTGNHCKGGLQRAVTSRCDLLPHDTEFEMEASIQVPAYNHIVLINVVYQGQDGRMNCMSGEKMDKAVIFSEFYIGSGQNAFALKFV